MAKIYSIVSGKGGVGKTTSAINLSAALVSLNRDSMVVDTNLSTPNIGLHLGSPVAPITLNHVLKGRARTIDAVYEHVSGIKIIPSSLSVKELGAINIEKIADLGREFRKISENTLLDSAPGLGIEAISSITAADEVIIITQAEMPAVTDALKTIKLVQQLQKRVKGFIINRYKNRNTEMSIDNIKDMLEVPLLGIIPEDKNMQKALNLKNPIVHSHPRSKSSRAYKKIAASLLDGEAILKEKTSFYARLKDRFGL